MMIEKDLAVAFNYTLTDEAGKVLDKSPEGQPLAYLHGHNNIIPGLEKQLEGKTSGDKLTAVVAPEEAYGSYHENAVRDIPREYFQGVDDIKVGMQFQSQTDDGQVMMVAVKAVNDDVITVDGNHPLAGLQLTFDVEIAEVREATEQELADGYIKNPAP